MINKKTFKPFRLEELNWGINIRDNPSEIEDKQAVDIVNFNFKWNKLVWEKWWTDTLNPQISEIGALTIDSWDIWTISDWVIYNNWVPVVEGTWILVTTSRDEFLPWVYFYITIEWTDYAIAGNTVEEFIINLKTAVENDWYLTLSQDNLLLIRKIDGSVIDYTVESNQAYVLYNNDNVLLYEFWKEYYWSIEINWVRYSWVYTMSDPNLNAWKVDIELLNQVKDALPLSLWASSVFIDSSFEVVDDYISNAWVIVNNVSSINELRENFYEYRINWYSSRVEWAYFTQLTSLTVDGNTLYWPYVYRMYNNVHPSSTWDYDITIILDWNSFNVAWVMLPSQFADQMVSLINSNWNYTAENVSNDIKLYRNDWAQIAMSWVNNSWTFYFWSSQQITFDSQLYWYDDTELENLLRDMVISQLNSIPWVIASEETKDWITWIYFRKSLWEKINIVDINNTNDLDITEIVRLWIELKDHTYEKAELNVTSLLAWDGLLWRSNVVIWNLWNLVVDKDDWWAFYSYDNINIKIGEDSIWRPTVWTIYNGKIILWWYDWNDNIIFSKTSSPTRPLNILDFINYSAGWQSVSGWDKWLITGMVVGENWLYVFKDNSIWYTNSEVDDPNSNSFNFKFNKITSNGALSQNVITEVDQEIFYLDWRSREVRRLWYEQNLTTLRDVAISGEISDLFDELPEEQPLATSHFKYPYYQLSLTDWQSDLVEYNNWNSYHTNNVHFVYNVENKSWTKRTWIDWLIVSDKWYFADIDWKVYKDFEWYTSEDWEYISKLYVFWDDVMYKRYWRFDIVGKIIPETGEEKTLTIEIYVDWELIDSRDITKSTTSQIREKIDLYDIGQDFQFKLKHSWVWRVEVHDVQIYYKWTAIQPQDFN